MNIQNDVYKLYNESLSSVNDYNNLLQKCVELYEMQAVVFIYDSMIKYGFKPTDKTFSIIEKLHSKTIQENNQIQIKTFQKTLKPRRRIHKIIKGYHYSKNYNNALIHLDKVKEYLNNNDTIKLLPRIKMAKHISKNCNISFNEARYIITNLKRTKFLKKKIYSLNNNHYSINESINKSSQTKLDSFFKLTRN